MRIPWSRSRGRPTDLRQLLLLLAYPRLREIPRDQWAAALRRARDTGFDAVEWIGVLGATGLVAWLLGGGRAPGPFLDFLLALPLLGVLAGPFYLRRTRRGLDLDLDRRKADPADGG